MVTPTSLPFAPPIMKYLTIAYISKTAAKHIVNSHLHNGFNGARLNI